MNTFKLKSEKGHLHILPNYVSWQDVLQEHGYSTPHQPEVLLLKWQKK